MWKKVTDTIVLEGLNIGDVLIKYPVDGSVADTFDDANPENISPRVVGNNEDEILSLNFIHSNAQSDPIMGMYRGGVMAPLIISYSDLINEGIWWYFEEE